MDEKEAQKIYTMRQVSKILNIDARFVRKYCNNGLVPGLKHTIGGHRIFDVKQMDWLRQLVNLSRAGFTTKDLRKYVQLAQDSRPDAVQERLAMLKTHKRQAWQELEDLQATIDFLERQEEMLEVDSKALQE